jgi:hypothetical protein
MSTERKANAASEFGDMSDFGDLAGMLGEVEQYGVVPKPEGPAEESAARELGELGLAFKQRADDENRRFELATDSEYWCCFCFQSRDQKEAFLAALSLLDLGDKYLDGWEVAKRLGIALQREEVPYNTSAKVDAKLKDLT